MMYIHKEPGYTEKLVSCKISLKQAMLGSEEHFKARLAELKIVLYLFFILWTFYYIVYCFIIQ